MCIKRSLLLLGVIALAALALCIVSDQAECRDAKWDGGGANNLASTRENWDLDQALAPGDNLIWDGTSTKSCTFDVGLNFGALSINSGYTAVITLSLDISVSGYSQAAGTITSSGTVVRWIYCSGNFSQTGGIITADKINLEMTGNDSTLRWINQSFGILKVSGTTLCTQTPGLSQGTFSLSVTNRLTIGSGVTLSVVYYYGRMFTNTGVIDGPGTIRFAIFNENKTLAAGMILAPTLVDLHASSTINYRICLVDDATIRHLTIQSSSASKTIEFDVNDTSLISETIIIKARGILRSGVGDITCGVLDSSAGSVVAEMATWTFPYNALIKMAAGGALYDVEVNGTALRLGSDVSMHSLTFLGLTSSHPYGLYYNGARNSSISSSASGTYTLDGDTFTWDNVTLLVTPVISIDGWQHTDGGFRNSVWQGYSYWADHDCDLPVTWSVTASMDWLSIDNEGTIYGVPDQDGTCVYTLTATHSNGEVATVSGHVVVETSATQAASGSVGALVGALVLVVIVSSVIMMVQRCKPK